MVLHIRLKLYSNLHIDRAERQAKDRMAAIRDVFEAVNKRWAMGMVPTDFVTIDETLYAARNRVSNK